MKKNSIMSLPVVSTVLKYIKLCFKSWYLFVACVVVCMLLAGAYLYIRKDNKTVEAQLMLRDSGGGNMMLSDLAAAMPMMGMFGSSSTDNESSIIRSHSVFLKTAQQMNLNIDYSERLAPLKWKNTPRNAAFRLIPQEGLADTISTTVSFKLKRLDDGKFDIEIKGKPYFKMEKKAVSMPATLSTPLGKFTIEKTVYFNKTEAEKFKITFSSYAAAAETYAKKVDVFVPDRKTDFIDLSLKTSDTGFGIDVLKTIITNYIDLANVYKTERNEQSLNLINDRLGSLEVDLKNSEKALTQFKERNKLTDVYADAKYLMEKTGELESSMLQTQTKFEVVKMTREFISNPKNKYELVPDLFATAGIDGASDGASSQISKYNDLLLQRMQILNSAKPGSTTMKQIDEQIDAMHANIVATVNRLYDNVSVAMRELKDESAGTKSILSDLPAMEREYIVLKRDNVMNEKMYVFLMQQREELRMQLESRQMPAQVIDPPHALTDDGTMRPIIVLFLAAFIGGLLALGLVFLRLKNAPFANCDELERDCKVPVLGCLANDDKADEGIVLANDMANAETIRSLRSELQLELKGCGGNVVTVTSMLPGEGKTYVAINLAASLAALGKKTLLVDAALRNPKTADLLGVTPVVAAVTDYVLGTTPDYPCMAHPAGNLSAVVSAETDHNASDIIGSERFAQMINKLKAEFDYVIIDADTIEGHSDMAYLTDLTDITLVVCRKKTARPSLIAQINKTADDGRLKRVAVVANAF